MDLGHREALKKYFIHSRPKWPNSPGAAAGKLIGRLVNHRIGLHYLASVFDVLLTKLANITKGFGTDWLFRRFYLFVGEAMGFGNYIRTIAT